MTPRFLFLRRLVWTFSIVIASAAVVSAQSGGFSFGGAATDNAVAVRAEFSADGRSGQLAVTATIQPGWHIYSLTQPSGGPLPSKIELAPTPGVRLAGPFRPTVAPHVGKEPEAFGDLPIETHSDTVTWIAPIELTAAVDPKTLVLTGKLSGQACAQACVLMNVPFSARWTEKTIVAPGEAPTAATASSAHRDTLWRLCLAAFLGGLILNVMPCVLPVISLKLMAFLEQSGESRGRVFLLNVWYSVGLLSVFMVLAALAATLGWAWGEQFTHVWFKVAMTAVVFVMALSFLGVWEIPIPGFLGVGRANQLQSKEGPGGAFFKGVFATILATPCSGPFLGPVFGYLLNQPPATVYAVFGAVGLGMASPYLVLGAFPQLIRLLPRPGAWMETVQQLMGFLLLGTVVYLFNTLSPRWFVPTLALLMGLWLACWWVGRTPLTASTGRRWTAKLGGLLVAALIGWFAFTVLVEESKIPWQPFSPQAVERARAQGKTVMVDFTANWCPNCKTNSKLAIDTEAVAALIRRNGVVPMLADWTDESPVIKKALNDLGHNSIPLLAIWPADRSQKVITLPDLLLESQVLDALQKAGPSQTK
ncbi:MAG: thioredoxin family protein [Planctomycetaceae bacterium]|nr:thioredoxin family protein [Planctomycetaceae bacterium]